MTVYARLHDPIRMCTKCGQDKAFDCFRVMTNRYGRPQRRTVCVECERTISRTRSSDIEVSPEAAERIATYKAERLAASREERERKHYHKHLKRKYGMDPETFYEMLAAQGGRCAICRSRHANTQKKRLNVDHCHETGQIRGLLCDGCNNGLGHFKDNIDSILRAVSYLAKTRLTQEEF